MEKYKPPVMREGPDDPEKNNALHILSVPKLFGMPFTVRLLRVLDDPVKNGGVRPCLPRS
jgi:hypothetical protein